MKLTHSQKKIIAFSICLLFLFGLTINTVLAECPPEGGGPCELDNPLRWGGSGIPLEENKDPRIVVGNIIRAALGFLGAVALAMCILGGYMWLFSAGNAEKIKKGRNTLVWAFIGLAVIFASYALISWVIGQLETIATP